MQPNRRLLENLARADLTEDERERYRSLERRDRSDRVMAEQAYVSLLSRDPAAAKRFARRVRPDPLTLEEREFMGRCTIAIREARRRLHSMEPERSELTLFELYEARGWIEWEPDSALIWVLQRLDLIPSGRAVAMFDGVFAEGEPLPPSRDIRWECDDGRSGVLPGAETYAKIEAWKPELQDELRG